MPALLAARVRDADDHALYLVQRYRLLSLLVSDDRTGPGSSLAPVRGYSMRKLNYVRKNYYARYTVPTQPALRVSQAWYNAGYTRGVRLCR